MKQLLILSFLIYAALSVQAQEFMKSPIAGTQGKDWIIVNYVDWDTIGSKDHHCGSKSYDGHQGTDFVIRSFRQMDSGVHVMAAEAGVITFIKDGLFDRETSSNVDRKLGNYIAIKHANDYYSYYGHLKKNSITVSVGDSIKAGHIIGQVGSSGNSTDPHLHFEVWYDSTYVVDPFAGDCGNTSTLWIAPEAYDTNMYIFESGLISKNNLAINDLRERFSNLQKPYILKPSVDSSLNFWVHLAGLRAGKKLTITWTRPDDTIWYTHTTTLDRDYWYYYYWSYINHDFSVNEGIWTVNLAYDNTIVASETFEVSKTADISKIIVKNKCNAYQAQSLSELRQNTALDISIYEFTGRKIDKTQPLQSGFYMLQIKQDYEVCTVKRHQE